MEVTFLKQLGREYQQKRNLIFHPRTKSSCKMIKPNKDVFYILGFLADGCLPLIKWKYEIEIYQKDKRLLNKIAEMFKKNFEVKFKMSLHQNIFRLRICSKPLYLYLKGHYEDVLKNLEKMKYKKSFIAGFVDAEGSLVRTKNGLRVAITQSDIEVLSKILRVLQELDIHSKIYGPYKHKNSKKDMYYLHIEGKHVNKFLKKIPSLKFFPIP